MVALNKKDVLTPQYFSDALPGKQDVQGWAKGFKATFRMSRTGTYFLLKTVF
jgi:hypothetical protein